MPVPLLSVLAVTLTVAKWTVAILIVVSVAPAVPPSVAVIPLIVGGTTAPLLFLPAVGVIALPSLMHHAVGWCTPGSFQHWALTRALEASVAMRDIASAPFAASARSIWEWAKTVCAQAFPDLALTFFFWGCTIALGLEVVYSTNYFARVLAAKWGPPGVEAPRPNFLSVALVCAYGVASHVGGLIWSLFRPNTKECIWQWLWAVTNRLRALARTVKPKTSASLGDAKSAPRSAPRSASRKTSRRVSVA